MPIDPEKRIQISQERVLYLDDLILQEASKMRTSWRILAIILIFELALCACMYFYSEETRLFTQWGLIIGGAISIYPMNDYLSSRNVFLTCIDLKQRHRKALETPEEIDDTEFDLMGKVFEKILKS